MPNPFLAPGDLARAGLAPHGLTIANPLVAEESVLRTSLRPGLFGALAYNASHRRPDVSLFEIGHVYRPAVGPLPDEREMVAVALANREGAAAVPVFDEIVAGLGLGRLVSLDQTAPGELPGLHPGRRARIVADGADVGALGEVDPGVLEAFAIPHRVAWLELDLTILLNLTPEIAQWRPVSRYPSSDVDLAFVVSDDVAAATVADTVTSAAGDVLADLALFDVYRGPGVPDDQRSLAYRLRLQAQDRTLTDGDVASVRDRVIAAVTALGATLRS